MHIEFACLRIMSLLPEFVHSSPLHDMHDARELISRIIENTMYEINYGASRQIAEARYRQRLQI